MCHVLWAKMLYEGHLDNDSISSNQYKQIISLQQKWSLMVFLVKIVELQQGMLVTAKSVFIRIPFTS